MQTAMNNDQPPPPRKLLRPANKLHQRRWLEQANQVSLELSGNQVQQSADPHGQVLRQLRQYQQRSPSEIATLACISLGQLYELETGGQRLFYSQALRQQASRRVAQLLGSDWDDIVAGKVTPLQLVRTLPEQAAPTAQVISLQTALPVSTLPSERAQAARSDHVSTPLPPSGVALLATPTADQAQASIDARDIEPKITQEDKSQEQPRTRSSGGFTPWVVALMLCAAMLVVAYQSGHLEALGLKF
jgi:hypothetical protein